jgi:hypothetical protein
MAPRDDELVRVHRAAWQGGSSSSRQRVRRLSQESVFDPLFTMRSDRQPVATHGNDFRVSEPFWGRPICHRLPLVAPARLFLKTGALSSARLADVTSSGAPGRWMLISFLAWLHTVSVGAVPASQFHKGPSGGKSQAGACRDRGARGGARRGLEGLVAGEHVPGGDQDLARDRGLGGVGVAGAAGDVAVELVPGVRFAPGLLGRLDGRPRSPSSSVPSTGR